MIDYKTLENEIMGKVAFVTADDAFDLYVELDGNSSDSTGFYNWIRIFKGKLFGYKNLRQGYSILDKFKLVVFDAHPAYFADFINIANYLKGKVVTAFQPEGDISLYDQWGIQTYDENAYKAMQVSDVIIPMEENEGYYKSLVNVPVKFVHVPISDIMLNGAFLIPRSKKQNNGILIYGDLNPTGPIEVIACARRLNVPITTVEIKEHVLKSLQEVFGVKFILNVNKLGQYPYMRLLGGCYLNIYPTRCVGSSRQPIACAASGTPCIGTDRSHTMKRLFPDLMSDPYDIDRMVMLAKKLYEDVEFYDSIVNKAFNALSFYSENSAEKRMLEAYAMGAKYEIH